MALRYISVIWKIALEYQASHPDTHITINQWLLIRDTIQTILIERNTVSAFRQNGFGDRQSAVSTFILRHLSNDVVIPVSSSYPTIDKLRCISPKGRTTLELSTTIAPELAFPKLPPMASPIPLPALVGPPVHVPVGGGGDAAPPRVSLETAFSSARAKPAAPVTLRVNPFAKYARPKTGPTIQRVRVSAASSLSASGVAHPVLTG